MKTKIVIIDDHAILRAGIQLLIDQEDDMEMIGQASDGHEGINIVRETKPDLVIMDVSMPSLNGIQATSRILEESPGTKILALSAYSNAHFVNGMLRAGVLGYVLKGCHSDELVQAIRIVSKGGQYLCSEITKLVVDNLVQGPKSSEKDSPLDILTERECELLQLISEGKSSKEAAGLLHLSIQTIDGRRRDIMRKLEVSSIAELTKLAVRSGLTTLEF